MICWRKSSISFNLRGRRTISDAEAAQREQIAYLSVAGCAPQRTPKGILCPQVAHERKSPDTPISLAAPSSIAGGHCVSPLHPPAQRKRVVFDEQKTLHSKCFSFTGVARGRSPLEGLQRPAKEIRESPRGKFLSCATLGQRMPSGVLCGAQPATLK